MARSRTVWALGLSLALHGALLALVLFVRAPRNLLREPIEVELRTVAPAPAPPQGPKADQGTPIAGAPAKPSRRKAERQQSPEPFARSRGASPEGGGAAGGQTVAGGKSGSRPEASSPANVGPSDLPRAAPLGPSAALGEQTVEQGARGSRTWGSLTRNEPGFGPDRQAVLDAERTAVKGRVDGWLADDLATARVKGGIVDDYFGAMKRRLEETVDKPESVLSGDFVKDFAAAWSGAAQQYASTGNPYREGERVGAAPALDGDRPLGQMARRYQGSATDAVAQKFEQGRVLRDFADGKFGQGLIAIVELRQGGDGHLLRARLLEPSGSLEFDAHVLRVAPQALSLLEPPPPTVKVPEGGLRSHWAFEGHIVYKRRLRDTTLLQDGWYLALAGMAGLMTGEFDQGGDATYVDLRHPELKVKVRLLRLYP
jgi:hypothetical protein